MSEDRELEYDLVQGAPVHQALGMGNDPALIDHQRRIVTGQSALALADLPRLRLMAGKVLVREDRPSTEVKAGSLYLPANVRGEPRQRGWVAATSRGGPEVGSYVWYEYAKGQLMEIEGVEHNMLSVEDVVVVETTTPYGIGVNVLGRNVLVEVVRPKEEVPTGMVIILPGVRKFTREKGYVVRTGPGVTTVRPEQGIWFEFAAGSVLDVHGEKLRCIHEDQIFAVLEDREAFEAV